MLNNLDRLTARWHIRFLLSETGCVAADDGFSSEERTHYRTTALIKELLKEQSEILIKVMPVSADYQETLSAAEQLLIGCCQDTYQAYQDINQLLMQAELIETHLYKLEVQTEAAVLAIAQEIITPSSSLAPEVYFYLPQRHVGNYFLYL